MRREALLKWFKTAGTWGARTEAAESDDDNRDAGGKLGAAVSLTTEVAAVTDEEEADDADNEAEAASESHSKVESWCFFRSVSSLNRSEMTTGDSPDSAEGERDWADIEWELFQEIGEQNRRYVRRKNRHWDI